MPIFLHFGSKLEASINVIYILINSGELEMKIFSLCIPERFKPRVVSRIANAAAISRRQSVQSNRGTPRFAILQSARSRMFLRVISNAISSQKWLGKREEGRKAGGGSGDGE